MPMATIRPVGDGLYHIHFLDQRTDPGYGQGGGFHPDQGLPGGRPDRPDQGLPGGGHISNRPPGSWEGRPDNTLPSNPHFPNNSLPDYPPPNVAGGQTLILVRTADGKWHYAALQPGTPPPRPLPAPPVAGQPLPPTAAPKPA